tara:strand:+ start:305 stop:580 length:276 start_codon:yes stop_codon:yes gene_type:complete
MGMMKDSKELGCKPVKLTWTHLYPTAKVAYPIPSLTCILAYKEGNGRNNKAIIQAFNTFLSDEYQDKATSLGFVPLKGDILEKSRAAVKKK